MLVNAQLTNCMFFTYTVVSKPG